jgi:Fe-S cluster assembly protein SufD
MEDKLFEILYTHRTEAIVSSDAQLLLIQDYKNIPVPTKKTEQWKYYNPEPLFEDRFNTASKNEIDISNFQSKYIIPNSIKISIVDGVVNCNISNKVKGIFLKNIKQAFAENPQLEKDYFNKTNTDKLDKFQSLNTCFATDGFVLVIEGKLQHPIEIVYINSGDENIVSQCRNIIITKENAEASILESHYSIAKGKQLKNIVTEIYTHSNSTLNFNLLQEETTEILHINTLKVNQYHSSKFILNDITLNGGLISNNVIVNHLDEYCETSLNGLFFPSANQHFENNTIVNHYKPNCTTNEIYRGIAKEDATGVFTGKIFVDKDSQKTLANQSNKNILLSNNATIHSKPQLEIFADDVSCSHGSTIGQLDKDALFYCMARGISYDNAIRLLLGAFFVDVIDNLVFEELKTFTKNIVATKI